MSCRLSTLTFVTVISFGLSASKASVKEDSAGYAVCGGQSAVVGDVGGVSRIVFFGDSITKAWRHGSPSLFSVGRINRGIGGQDTSQMLLRFHQDVIALRPALVHIIAGINDVAGNGGNMTDEQTRDYIRSMVELARMHGIRVVLGSLPPAEVIPWRRSLVVGDRISALNRWIGCYAKVTGSGFVDYSGALERNGWPTGLTLDGVHPSTQGYRIMSPLAEAAIKVALASPPPDPAIKDDVSCDQNLEADTR
jgi:lysophospholipase L1-like esterase